MAECLSFPVALENFSSGAVRWRQLSWHEKSIARWHILRLAYLRAVPQAGAIGESGSRQKVPKYPGEIIQQLHRGR